MRLDKVFATNRNLLFEASFRMTWSDLVTCSESSWRQRCKSLEVCHIALLSSRRAATLSTILVEHPKARNSSEVTETAPSEGQLAAWMLFY